MASAGVLHPRVFLGRLFISAATSLSHGQAQSCGFPDERDRPERTAGLPDRRLGTVGATVPAITEGRCRCNQAHERAGVGEPALRLSTFARHAAARGAGREPQAHLPPLYRAWPASAYEEAAQAAPARPSRPASAGTADAAMVDGFRQ